MMAPVPPPSFGRLSRIAGHVVAARAAGTFQRRGTTPTAPPPTAAAAPTAETATTTRWTNAAGDDAELKRLFGSHAYSEGPLIASGGGVRYVGIDLAPQLAPDQVEFLLDALAQHRIVCVAGQDLERFSMGHFERFANHYGAVLPHPNNFTRGGVGAQGQGATDGEIEWIPFEARTVSRANATFPGELQCLAHESPAVLVTSNFGGPQPGKLGAGIPDSGEVDVGGGGSWHTDIEYEPEPIHVSMFLVHKAPVSRNAQPGGTWVADPGKSGGYFDGSEEELMRLRNVLPLNGETAFADTAAAFAALPADEQAALEKVMVRRRLNEGDEGWLAPLVRTNERSGIKSLHSPIWASRPRVRPAIEVDGMSMEDSRAFLDRLEAHCLQPQFRYDHVHTPGDVTLWHNYMTLHNSVRFPPSIATTASAPIIFSSGTFLDPVVVCCSRRQSATSQASMTRG